MEYMAGLPDKAFDLAIVDPPYGLGEGQKRVDSRSRKTDKWKTARPPKYGGGTWDNEKPKNKYFDELKRVTSNRIIWGANHFGNMPPSSAWIVWYKKRFDEVNDFSDFEAAYTSFKCGARLFHFPWIGFGAVNAGETRIHPTQKPVALYKWLLTNYAKPGDRILDTHGGSGSICIACHDLGFDLTWMEKDEDYYNAAVKRYKQHAAQLQIFAV